MRIVFNGCYTLREQLTLEIRKALNKNDWPVKDKSILIGVSPQKVGRLMLGSSTNISLDCLLGVADKLGITIVGEVRV